MKRREGGNVEEKVIETIFHRALSRVAPLVAPRPRLILAGETEDKGGTREEGKKGNERRSSMRITVGAEIFSRDVERRRSLSSSSVSILSSDNPVDLNACGVPPVFPEQVRR